MPKLPKGVTGRQVVVESMLNEVPEEIIAILKRGDAERELPRIERQLREAFKHEELSKVLKALDELPAARHLLRVLGKHEQTLKGLDSILDARSGFFRDVTLARLYLAYQRRVLKRGGQLVPPLDWARKTLSKPAILRLKVILGSGYKNAIRKVSQRPIAVAGIPDDISEAQWLKYAKILEDHEDLLFRKLPDLLNPQRPALKSALATRPTYWLMQKFIWRDRLNNLKGNIAEALSHRRQMEFLAKHQKELKEGTHKAAKVEDSVEEVFLVTDVRYSFLDLKGVPREAKEFTDNVIMGRTKSGSYRILHIFEVKSRSRRCLRSAEAASQEPRGKGAGGPAHLGGWGLVQARRNDDPEEARPDLQSVRPGGEDDSEDESHASWRARSTGGVGTERRVEDDVRALRPGEQAGQRAEDGGDDDGSRGAGAHVARARVLRRSRVRVAALPERCLGACRRIGDPCG